MAVRSFVSLLWRVIQVGDDIPSFVAMVFLFLSELYNTSLSCMDVAFFFAIPYSSSFWIRPLGVLLYSSSLV
jgi:hypothetical protein